MDDGACLHLISRRQRAERQADDASDQDEMRIRIWIRNHENRSSQGARPTEVFQARISGQTSDLILCGAKSQSLKFRCNFPSNRKIEKARRNNHRAFSCPCCNYTAAEVGACDSCLLLNDVIYVKSLLDPLCGFPQVRTGVRVEPALGEHWLDRRFDRCQLIG